MTSAPRLALTAPRLALTAPRLARSAPRLARTVFAALALVVLLAGCAVAAPAPEVVAADMEGRVQAEIEDLMIDGVPVRRYEPAVSSSEGSWATLVWAHGGSFVHGNLDWPEAHWVSSRLAESGVRVVSVDYALATDVVKAPVPADDVTTVLRWALAEYAGPVVVGGASAGAHLAALAALSAADGPSGAAALVLAYPTLHRVQRADVELALATAGLPERRRFGAERIAAMYDYYLGGVEPGSRGAERVRIVGELPGSALAALPPTIIVNAERDDLRASGEQFAEQLVAAGVPVVMMSRPGTVHGYLNRPEQSAAALADASATVEFVVDTMHELLDSVPA